MRTMNMSSFVRRLINDQVGQVLPWVTLMMVSLIGMAGLTIDVGHAYVVKAQLQGCSSAAALSAAENVYLTGATDSANSLATTYSCGGGDKNAIAALGTVTSTVTTPCLNLLMTSGTGCTNTNGNASGTSLPNAVKIKQTVAVPTYFMNVLGVPSLNVSATATASFGTSQPYNVAIIIDATGSMFSSDKYCPTSGLSSEQCAFDGVQNMLSAINPCKPGVTSCNSASANAIFRVALFTFPNITTANVPQEFTGTCNGKGTVASALYSFPNIPTGLTSPYTYVEYKSSGVKTDVTYMLTQQSVDSTNIDANGFTSDYYQANGSGLNLNPNSKLVKAIGNGATGTCLKEPTGQPSNSGYPALSGITYQAGAIYAAQQALQAEQVQTTNLGLNAINAIVFVTDGQANAPKPQFNPTTATVTGGSGGTATMTGTGAYPDDTQDCQQTIAAAQYAISQKTRFYGVAYGSESDGCAMDTKVVLSAPPTLNVALNSGNLTPCTIMEDVSSDYANDPSQWYFYAEGQSVANGCSPSNTDAKDTLSIFNSITATFTSPRLISNNAS